MKNNEQPLTIGISKQGRVLPEIQEILQQSGYEGIDWNNGGKEFMIPEIDVKLVLVKGIEEIAYRVDKQLMDGLIMGSDVVLESNLLIKNEVARRKENFQNVMKSVVDTERCQARLSLLQPFELDLPKAIKDGASIDVLSKYSLQAKAEIDRVFGPSENIYVREIESQADVLAGITRSLSYDIVSSGNTARQANLEESYWKYVNDDIKIPKPISTSLQLFNTTISSQDNRMIDFASSIRL